MSHASTGKSLFIFGIAYICLTVPHVAAEEPNAKLTTEASYLQFFQNSFRYSNNGVVVFSGRKNYDIQFLEADGSVLDCGPTGQCGPNIPIPPIPPVPGGTVPFTLPGLRLQPGLQVVPKYSINQFQSSGQLQSPLDCGEGNEGILPEQCGPTIPIEDE